MGLNSNGQCGIIGVPNIHSPTAVHTQADIVGITSGCLALHSFFFGRGVPLERAPLPRVDLQSLTVDIQRLSGTNPSAAMQRLREHIAASFSSISVLNTSFLRREHTGATHDLAYSQQTHLTAVDLESVREAYRLLLSTGRVYSLAPSL
jgi:hypothetical protein